MIFSFVNDLSNDNKNVIINSFIVKWMNVENWK